MPESIQPVLLVGGAGTRLAPLSTPDCPKPFIPLPAGGSLLQHSVARLAAYSAPVLVGQARHRFALANHVAEAGVAPAAMLLEPALRNTAMAVAVAVAHHIATRDHTQLLAILPADHAIADEAAWHCALQTAARRATTEGRLALIGMQDAPPSSELGYMQLADGLITMFLEKPADASALAQAGWLANSGQFIGQACVFADAFAQHAPLIWHAAQRAVAEARCEGDTYWLSEAAYAPVLPVAFDRAVIEKATGLAGVASQCGWRDIGTLAAFCAYACLPQGSPAPYPRSDHPWGYAELIASRPGSLAKCLTLYPGQRLSLQRHQRRVELWLVIEGEANAVVDDRILTLSTGASLPIPQHSWHRLINTGSGILRIMELQLGWCDEADIERAEDDYGRA